MWNRSLVIFCIAGLISFAEVFPQDSTVVPDEVVVDSPSTRVKRVYPRSLSPFQRDSIIQAISKDTSAISQRHFDQSLVKKYATDSDLDYERNINKSPFQRLREAIVAWFKRLLGSPDTSGIDNLTDKVLNFLLVVVFLVAIYIAVRLFMNHRGRWFFEKKNEVVSVNLSNVEKHIHEADFNSLLKEAEQSGDTRQSIRLLYLWLLKKFTDNNIIRWNPDKTNIDYLFEIRDKGLQEQFRYLSYLYNYIWYGGFSINDTEYRDTRETFLRHIKTETENE